MGTEVKQKNIAVSNRSLALQIQTIHLPIIAIMANSSLKILCWLSLLSARITIYFRYLGC